MKHTQTHARRVRAAALLTKSGFADVAAFLLAQDKAERETTKPKRKRKAVLYTPRGEKIELYRDTVKQLEQTDDTAS